MRKMYKRKWLLSGLMLMTMSTLLMVGGLFGLDRHLHKKYESLAGLNIRGYRGPVVNRKQPDEQRIVVLGGSTAFGYAVSPQESLGAFLERKLNDPQRGIEHPISVVNLAYNNDGAYSFQYTMRYYDYLDYDVAILYAGYNDLGQTNTSVFRHDSQVFKLTGYRPIFPIVFGEMVMAIRDGVDSTESYMVLKTVFKPNLADRATASALETAININKAFERQLDRFTKEAEVLSDDDSDLECGERFNFYCESMQAAVDYLLSGDKKVVVVTQPYHGDLHIAQQAAMSKMLERQYGDDPRVHYVNLGRGVVDLKDNTLCFDGMHLTRAGYDQLSDHLVKPVLRVLGKLKSARHRGTGILIPPGYP